MRTRGRRAQCRPDSYVPRSRWTARIASCRCSGRICRCRQAHPRVRASMHARVWGRALGACPSLVMSRLAPLMSRWQTPCECSHSRPCKTCGDTQDTDAGE
eukprot:3446573-Pleurochrysis_carterae.AAC.2